MATPLTQVQLGQAINGVASQYKTTVLPAIATAFGMATVTKADALKILHGTLVKIAKDIQDEDF